MAFDALKFNFKQILYCFCLASSTCISIFSFVYTLLEKCWRSLLYVTDDAVAKLYT